MGDLDSKLCYASMVASADYDNDGDIDLVIGNWPAQPGEGEVNLLFRNEGPVGNSLRLSLRGTKSNRSGIGARVEVFIKDDSGGRTITRYVKSQDGWRSQSSLEIHIGLGEAKIAESAKIHWPSGIIQEVKSLKHGKRHIITEPSM